MPIPYKNYRDGAASMPIESIKVGSDDEGMDYLEMCADDLKHALKAGDSKAIAAALRAAFELLDSEPHVEGPHTNEE
jgi:hypothetical protein